MLNLKFDDIDGVNNIVKYTKPDPFKGLDELLASLFEDDENEEVG